MLFTIKLIIDHYLQDPGFVIKMEEDDENFKVGDIICINQGGYEVVGKVIEVNFDHHNNPYYTIDRYQHRSDLEDWRACTGVETSGPYHTVYSYSSKLLQDEDLEKERMLLLIKQLSRKVDKLEGSLLGLENKVDLLSKTVNKQDFKVECLENQFYASD